MVVITIHFLNGVYQATPWGKHVNEGIPEWPPSSWRLLRAIIAIWKNTKPDLKDELILPILKKLASSEPEYHLPDASVSHTRHYMPTNNKGKKSIVMNTFVIVGKKPIQFIWPDINLVENEIKALEEILENMHYFGRAESWCKVTTSCEELTSNCIPFSDDINTSEELVTVLVPKKDVKFIDIAKKNPGKEDLDAITVTTKELQDRNYIEPPGGKFIQYTRPQNCFEGKTTSTKTSLLSNITVIRYAVTGSPRPLIKETLRIGDIARNACMSRYGKRNDGSTSGIFSGKDGDGNPLRGHIHASYLPTYEVDNRYIDHLTIFSPNGFDSKELEVLFSLKKLYRSNIVDVNLVFEGCGRLENFTDVKIFRRNNLWRSSTPLILTRHVKNKTGDGSKRRITDSPEEQIINEIQNRYGDEYELRNVTISEKKILDLNMHDFFRWRNHGSIGNGRTYNIELEFKKAISGPITLGYASHYGLGMFVPVGEK